MATAATEQLYPFSTENSDPIPLEIIRPLAVSIAAVAADTVLTHAIPEGYELAFVYSDIDVIIDFTNALAVSPPSGNFTNALMVPANTIITSVIPATGNIKIAACKAEEAGNVYFQKIQKWAGIGLRRQITTR